MSRRHLGLLVLAALAASTYGINDTYAGVGMDAQLEAAVLASGLFDAAWYLNMYPDAAQPGLTPVQHFLQIGGLQNRDPGPNFSSSFYVDTHPRMRKRMIPLLHFLQSQPSHVVYDGGLVLRAAARLSDTGSYDQALALAQKHLPEDLMHTLHLLKANAAQAKGLEDVWLHHVNRYLSHFGIAEVELGGTGETLFSRLASDALQPVESGPLVTVILPAGNAEGSIEMSAMSILNQTWRSLELIIVDDASTDGTWQICNRIAARDGRVRLLRNKVSTGPYIAKNSALLLAKGEYVTGHDADDWSHPQRLERQMAHLASEAGNYSVSVMYMLRMTKDGHFVFLQRAGWLTTISMVKYFFDGTARLSFISALFKRQFLVEQLGFWDSVRFAADSDILFRANLATQGKVLVVPIISMFCLDSPHSLTGGLLSKVGKNSTMTPARREYSNNYKLWWRSSTSRNQTVRVEFPLAVRPFPTPSDLIVPQKDICTNLLNLPRDVIPPKALHVCGSNVADYMALMPVVAAVSTGILVITLVVSKYISRRKPHTCKGA